MGDEKNRAPEITATGWRVLDRYPVTFWKPSTQAAIPEPISGGSINEHSEHCLRVFTPAGNNCSGCKAAIDYIFIDFLCVPRKR